MFQDTIILNSKFNKNLGNVKILKNVSYFFFNN